MMLKFIVYHSPGAMCIELYARSVLSRLFVTHWIDFVLVFGHENSVDRGAT